MRAVVAAAALFVGVCASAPESSETTARFVAAVMIAALPPEESGTRGYEWQVASARVSLPVRWHGEAFAPFDMEGTGLRRNGWLEAPGEQFDVILRGSHVLVRQFSIDVQDAIETDALLTALRAEGADISFAGDDESAMFYYVTLPGRQTAQLEARSRCTPPGSRAAHHCRTIMSWNYETE